MRFESSPNIPGWFVGLMMLCAGAITAWVNYHRLGLASAAPGAFAQLAPASAPAGAPPAPQSAEPCPLCQSAAAVSRTTAPATGSLPSLALAAPVAKTPAWLGLELAPLDAQSSARAGLPVGIRGLLVASVGAEAAAAGLSTGDLVVAVDGKRTVDLQQFSAATLRGASPGALIEVVRAGTLYRVFLGKAPPPLKAASSGQPARGPEPTTGAAR
jgi:hypothetical protein